MWQPFGLVSELESGFQETVWLLDMFLGRLSLSFLIIQ